jgi:hypothetical protein
MLHVADINELLKRVDSFLCVTICLPHIKSLDHDVAVKMLMDVMILLCSSLKQTSSGIENKSETELSESMQVCSQSEVTESEESIQIIILVLATVLETLIHLTHNETLKKVCGADMLLDSLLPYARDPKNLSALRALDLYFTACKIETEEDCYCLELFKRLHSELLRNLSSPFHEVISQL